MKGSNQHRINIGLGLAVLIFSLTAVVSYRSMTKLSETAASVAHSYEVLEDIEALFSTLKDAETGQRGYIITGNEDFLEPYLAASYQIDPLFQSVRNLTADNPNQQRRLDFLAPLIAQRLEALKEGLSLRKEGFEPAMRFVLKGRGKEEMDAIRKMVAEMKQEENGLRVQREKKSKAQTLKTTALLGVAAAVGLVILSFVFYLLNREIAERKRTEKALAKQTGILQSVLASMGEGVVVADLNGKFLLWNPAAEQMIPLGPIDAPSVEWSERYGIYLPDQVTRYPSDLLPLARAVRGESVDADEQFLRHPKAPQGVWLSVTGRPLKDASGAPLGGVVVFNDVTERKRAEAVKSQANSRLTSLVEALEESKREMTVLSDMGELLQT
jgi:CHASE3 domain sensor protein